MFGAGGHFTTLIIQARCPRQTIPLPLSSPASSLQFVYIRLFPLQLPLCCCENSAYVGEEDVVLALKLLDLQDVVVIITKYFYK